MKHIHYLLFVICHFSMIGQGKEERLCGLVKGSEIVIEGHPIGSECIRTKYNHLYTLHDIRIDRIFKGSLSDTVITVYTRGGRMGDEIQECDHCVQLGGRGQSIFFLRKFEKLIFSESEVQVFEIYSNYAGIIRLINEQGKIIGTTVNFQFNDIEEELYKPLKRIVEQNSQ